MSQQTKPLYEFGHFTLDGTESRLLRDGQPVPLAPKVLETLIVLIENGGHVIDKKELMERLWPDSFVEEANLAVNISQLRKALGDDENGGHFIETVPKRGYRFAAQVTKILAERADLVVHERTRSRIVIDEEEATDGHRDVETSARNQTESRPATKSIAETSVNTRPLRKVALGALAALIITTAGVVLYKAIEARRTDRLKTLTMTRLPTTGQSVHLAISPSGEFVVRGVAENGQMSLRLIQLATGSELSITEPERTPYGAMAFSPDGQNIYYTKISKEGGWALYEVPTLGKASKMLIANASTSFALSPDGMRLTFVREDQKESALLIANADGSGEQKLTSCGLPRRFDLMSWSPDGKALAVSALSSDAGGRYYELIEVALKDGQENKIGSKRWVTISGLAWLSDGSGIMLTAKDRLEDPSQIWQISYPDGQARRVTNDLNKYQFLSINAASSVLVTRKTDTLADVWVVSDGGSGPAKQITSRHGKNLQVCWTPDGRLVYSSARNTNSELWIMNSDGTDQKQLTVGAGYDTSPAVTGDGRYVLFESTRSGATNIWRADLDGTNLTQLTRGNNDRNPQPFPDGRWVVYESRDAAIPTLWKVSIDGGAAVQLVEKKSWQPTISPDGKRIAFAYQDEPNSASKFAVIPSDGGAPIKVLANASYTSNPRWSPDGSALTYTFLDEAGVFDVWSLPVNGGTPKRLTHFDTTGINSLSWSPDGKRLAVVRLSDLDEVLLIRNFR